MSRTLILGDPVVHLGDEDYLRRRCDRGRGRRRRRRRAAPSVRGRDLRRGARWPRPLRAAGLRQLPLPQRGRARPRRLRADLRAGQHLDALDVRAHARGGPAQRGPHAADRAIRGGQTGVVDMYYGNPNLPAYGADVVLDAYEAIGMRVAFGLVTRDQNRYVHQSDDAFRSCLPAQLAQELAELADRLRVAGRRRAVHLPAAGRRLGPPRRAHPHDPRARLDARPAPTPCTAARAPWPTSSAPASPRTRWRRAARCRSTSSTTARPRCSDWTSSACSGTTARWRTSCGPPTRTSTCWPQSGSVCSNDPGSNLRLSSGIARTRDILERGGLVGFGTDGISFGDREDFFDELRLAGLLQRRPMELASGRIPSAKLLRAPPPPAPARSASSASWAASRPARTPTC